MEIVSEDIMMDSTFSTVMDITDVTDQYDIDEEVYEEDLQVDLDNDLDNGFDSDEESVLSPEDVPLKLLCSIEKFGYESGPNGKKKIKEKFANGSCLSAGQIVGIVIGILAVLITAMMFLSRWGSSEPNYRSARVGPRFGSSGFGSFDPPSSSFEFNL